MAIYSDPEALRQRQEDMKRRMENRKEIARMGGKNPRIGRKRIRRNKISKR